MQAIILAGGLGSRLKSVVSNVPKPMAPINDKPFLDYLLQYLMKQGITKVVLSLHHQYEIIQAHYKEGFSGLDLSSVVETQLLGTGGAIKFAMQLLDSSQPFFVINGDTFVELDYRAMYQKHLETSAKLTLSLHEILDCSRYGTVHIEGDHVVGFVEKKSNAKGFINAGVYVVSHECFKNDEMPAIFSLEKDFLNQHVTSLRPRFVMTNGYFIDIGIPSDYERANRELHWDNE